MTWDDIAAPHVDHKAKLTDTRHLRCFDCAVTLVLPREAITTASPPPFQRRDGRDAATPEQIAFRKREAEAALELARQKRTTVVEDPS